MEKEEAEEKLEMVLNWAEDHPKFDTGFVESLQDALETYGRLTEAQGNALDNIIDRFRIDP